MSLKIVQHNKETIETCQEKSNGIFKGMPHTKGAQQTKPLCISKKNETASNQCCMAGLDLF